jgi:hypothetical protein
VSTIPYCSQPVALSPEALTGFKPTILTALGRPEAIDITGRCPTCHDFVHYVIHLREFLPDPAETGAGGGTAKLHPFRAKAALPRPQNVTLNCNCASSHRDGTHEAKSGGCGSWFNLGVLVDGVDVALSPGSPELSLYEEQNAQTRDRLAGTELDRVRAAAASWKTGLAALFALIPTLVVVKGTDAVDKLTGSDKIIVGGLIAFGAALAMTATMIALRAAYGPLKRSKVLGDDLTVPVMSEVQRTIFALQITRALTIVGSAALAAAIAYTWASSPAPVPTPAYFSVSLSNGTSVCGKLAGADPAAVRVQTANGETVAFSLADVKSTTFVASC